MIHETINMVKDMKKIFSALLLLTLVAGCSAQAKTTVCEQADGDMTINLSITSQKDKVLTHTSVATVDLSLKDWTEAEITKLIEDATAKYDQMDGYTFEAIRKSAVLTETLTVDYAKVNKTTFEDDYDNLENLLTDLKGQGFTCK